MEHRKWNFDGQFGVFFSSLTKCDTIFNASNGLRLLRADSDEFKLQQFSVQIECNINKFPERNRRIGTLNLERAIKKNPFI